MSTREPEEVTTSEEPREGVSPRTPSARFRWPVVLVVSALVTGALTAIFWDRGPASDPGTIVDGTVSNASEGLDPYRPTEDTRWVAPLPQRELSIDASVGDQVRVDEDTHVADGTARWVEIQWEPSDRDSVLDPAIWPGASLSERQEPSSRLVLMAGGDRYVLADSVLSSSHGASLTIAVASADDLHFAVEAGGRAQKATLEDRGDSSHPGQEGCQDNEATATNGVETSAGCYFEAVREAYVPGLGWAPRGRDWVVVKDVRGPSELDGAQDSVATWKAGKADEVTYDASGRPALTVSVSGGGKPVKTFGKPSLTRQPATLEMRAYLVPSTKPTDVTLNYRTTAIPDPEQEQIPANAPKRTTVTVTATQTLDAGGLGR